MAKALMIGGPENGAVLGSGSEVNVFGWSDHTTTEANAQASCTEGATFSGLRTRVISGNSGTASFRFRDAGANGQQNAQVTGTGVAEDATNTDTLSAGDLFNIAYTDTGSGSGLAWVTCNIEMASGYGCIHGSGFFVGRVCDAASSTTFFNICGVIPADGDATEVNQAWRTRAYTSWEAFQVRVTANARTNDSVFKNRINLADGTGLITFGAGITGLIEDTAIGDAIADTDELDASLTLLTGVEDLTVIFIAGTLKSTNIKQDVFMFHGAARAASATAHYAQIGGYCNNITVRSEAEARIKIGYAGTASNLRCYLSANTYGGAGTLKLMQNGSAVITLTLGAGGGAAWYENTSDSVTFDEDDEFSYEFDEGTSGSITIQMVGMTLAPTVAAAGGVGHRVIGGGWGGRVMDG